MALYPTCQTSIHNIEFFHGCFAILIVYHSMLSSFISYAMVLVRPDDPGTDRGSVTPSLQKDINRAIIYVPGSSHTYIQQNEQYITAHIM